MTDGLLMYAVLWFLGLLEFVAWRLLWL